jgi:hypothetical protein
MRELEKRQKKKLNTEGTGSAEVTEKKKQTPRYARNDYLPFLLAPFLMVIDLFVVRHFLFS